MKAADRGDSGLNEISAFTEQAEFQVVKEPSSVVNDFSKDSYVEHLLSYVDLKKLKPLRIVVNSGNGSSGLIIDKLEAYLPFEFIRINHAPDGTFSSMIPGSSGTR